MKTVTIAIDEFEEGQPHRRAEKKISFEEFQRFSWSTIAEAFLNVVTELDAKLDAEKS